MGIVNTKKIMCKKLHIKINGLLDIKKSLLRDKLARWLSESTESCSKYAYLNFVVSIFTILI